MEYCQNVGKGYGGNLVSIHNAFQNTQVASVGQKANENCLFWIGLSDLDDTVGFTWSDQTPYDYQFWDEGFPPKPAEGSVTFMGVSQDKRWKTTFDISEQHCFVCIQDSSSTPYTLPTIPFPTTTTPHVGPTTTGPNPTTTPVIGPTTTLSGVCNPGWVQFGSACYSWSDIQTVASDADANCVASGGHLVSILSAEEKAFISERTEQKWYFWLGLIKDADTWVWRDGNSVSYTNWCSGCPYDNEDYLCAYADYTTDGTWFNGPCTDHFLYICKQQLAASMHRKS